MRKLVLMAGSILLLSLAGCGGGNPGGSAAEPKVADTKQASTEAPPNASGEIAGASSVEANFPISYLNDGKAETAWGALSNSDDVYAYLTLTKPLTRPTINIQLFSPGGRNHLNEIRIVAKNDRNDAWTFIRSRLTGTRDYAEKISVPKGADASTISIELDPSATNGNSYKVYGIACLRKSKGDVPNYLGNEGTGVYIREMTIKE